MTMVNNQCGLNNGMANRYWTADYHSTALPRDIYRWHQCEHNNRKTAKVQNHFFHLSAPSAY
jgi:hypothetical protein